MVKIRLQRCGTHKSPYYRVVVADSRSPRDGRFIENIGYYHPLRDEDKLNINEERALEWLSKGAQPSDTVKSLFNQLGLNAKFVEAKKNNK